MPFTTFTGVVANHTAVVGDDPGTTGEQFKTLLDKGVVDTKAFINAHIAELELVTGTAALTTNDQTLNGAINELVGATVAVVGIDDSVVSSVLAWSSNKVDTQLSQIVQLRPNYYYVGSTQKYTTINAAYNQWVADGKVLSIIYILAGEYNEQLWAFNCLGNLSIIGEDKHTVVWHTKTGYYRNAPLSFSNGYLKNITFIADMTDNPGFVYSPLISDGFASDIGSAYALHIDFAGAETIVENCDMISYVNAGLGCGTHQDQTLKLINCNIYSYTPTGFDTQAFDNGGMLYHSYPASGTTGQRLIMHNVNVFSEYGMAASIQNLSPDASNEIFMEFINVNLSNNNSIPLLHFSSAFGLTLSESNYANNCYELNSPISGYIPELATPDACVKNGFYIIAASSPDGGSTNTIIQTTMVNSLYGIQNAWILATGIEYIRAMVNGTWSAWSERVLLSAIATNIFSIFNLGADGYAKTTYTNPDACVKTGIYITTANSPDGGTSNSVIHCSMVNSTYGIQIGYILATAVAYKRAMAAGTWGSWSLV